jgi:predicted Na+-dependent transporter
MFSAFAALVMRGGFLKLNLFKMKYFVIIFIFLGLLLTYFIININRGNKKSRITQLIENYKDSIGRQKAALVLVEHAPTFAYAKTGEIMSPQAINVNERMRIKSKIWGYQYKIDSLNIELKKY